MRKRQITISEIEQYGERFIKRYPGCGKDVIKILQLYAEGIDVNTISKQSNYGVSAIYKMANKFREYRRRTNTEIEVIEPMFMHVLTDDMKEYKFILFLFASFLNRDVDRINVYELPPPFDELHERKRCRDFVSHLREVQVEFDNTGNPIIEYFVQYDKEIIDCHTTRKTIMDLFLDIRYSHNYIHYRFIPTVEYILLLGKITHSGESTKDY